jgi:hypothetical protein
MFHTKILKVYLLAKYPIVEILSVAPYEEISILVGVIIRVM